ncbi:hypothetical protein [Sporomusa sp.]|uniref:hypothetical protein n=1 Tax=Sporomusa sp. TaxID=2078658 RepID=UPI002B8B5F20|nr:hypothetical protein [Sporomusa sp.]HWR44801.1 hypothetical protein [Sporomusa sp.]
MVRTGQVGQLYESGQDKLEEKIMYRLDSDGHGLVIVKAGIINQEVENIQYGAAELSIYIDGPIIFLLFKFGTDSWNDAPFSWHTVPRGIRVYPEEVADTATLKVTLVDAGDGIVRGVREVAMTPEFAGKLNEVITIQANGSFNGLSYAKHLNIVYNQYTAEDMADMASVHMIS